MNPSNTPPWGCPWHGLVKAGSLTLPNDQALTYPQPDLQGVSPGDTALIHSPLAQPASTPSEGDLLAGRQWLGKAVLAGGASLHGKYLGGWIYIDPNGETWLADSQPSGEGIASLSLARFGVFGGPREVFNYTYTIPPLGDTPALDLRGSAVKRWHTNKIGAAAVFALLGYPRATGAAAQEYLDAYQGFPIAWFEVLLSGSGRDCTVTCSVLHARPQALGEFSEANTIGSGVINYQAYLQLGKSIQDTRVGFPTCSGQRTEVWSPSFGWGASTPAGAEPQGSISVGAGTYSTKVIGRVLAIFYNEDGSRSQFTCDTEFSGELALPEPTSSVVTAYSRTDTLTGSNGSSCNSTTEVQALTEVATGRTCTNSERLKFTVKKDGVVIYEDDRTVIASSESTTAFHYSGEVFTGDMGRIRAVTQWSPGSLYESVDDVVFLYDYPALSPYITGPSIDKTGLAPGYTCEWDGIYTEHRPMRFSNLLHGVVGRAGVSLTITACAAPVAVAPISEVITVGTGAYPKRHGSWCPITFAAVIDAAPICYV